MNSLIHRTCGIPSITGQVSVAPTRRTTHLVPRAQVTETQEALVIQLEMPGLSREAVEVTIENDELTVVGRRAAAVEGEEKPAPFTVLLRERPDGDYRRTFVLGERLDAASISATMTHGVLTVTIPKGERAKPRTVEVQ